MSSFDAAAAGYDSYFSHSLIGKLQRQLVWAYLKTSIPKSPLRILEINGGTGEDAIWFAKQGHQVLCTDFSQAMLDVARKKVSDLKLEGSIDFQMLDVRDLSQIDTVKPYDLVFSNFAGLNCVDDGDLNQVFENIKPLLRPNGRFIGVFLGRFCFWESLYFGFKGSIKKAFRRKSRGPVVANVEGESVSTWYYSPREIENSSKSHFLPMKTLPIAVFIPPSYLEPFFQERKSWLQVLKKLDSFVDQMGFMANFSDHYLIDLKVKP